MAAQGVWQGKGRKSGRTYMVPPDSINSSDYSLHAYMTTHVGGESKFQLVALKAAPQLALKP